MKNTLLAATAYGAFAALMILSPVGVSPADAHMAADDIASLFKVEAMMIRSDVVCHNGGMAVAEWLTNTPKIQAYARAHRDEVNQLRIAGIREFDAQSQRDGLAANCAAANAAFAHMK
jgi:hypothetical protein